jgi:hypothetical protein
VKVDNQDTKITLDEAIKKANEELKAINPTTNSKEYQKKIDEITLLQERKTNEITPMTTKEYIPEYVGPQKNLESAEPENTFGFYLTLKTIKTLDIKFENAAKDKVKELLINESYSSFMTNMKNIFYAHLDVPSFDKLSPAEANAKLYDVYQEVSKGGDLLNKLGFWLIIKEIVDGNSELEYNSKFATAITPSEWQSVFNASASVTTGSTDWE